MERGIFTFVLAIILSLTHGVRSKSPVYFSLFASGGENGFRSSGAIPAIDIALEMIERNQLLPGYNFTYETWRDSKVHPNIRVLSSGGGGGGGGRGKLPPQTPQLLPQTFKLSPC